MTQKQVKEKKIKGGGEHDTFFDNLRDICRLPCLLYDQDKEQIEEHQEVDERGVR